MKVLGIIAEYNPFHKGHFYHLEKSKSMVNPDFTVAVISGNITQRGEPALWDKWTRAQDAVKSGVDLVLEMPVGFACNSAEYFARGGISVLEALGRVTHLSFGSECGETEPLLKIAEIKSGKNTEYEKQIRNGMNNGLSYPAAAEKAISEVLGTSYADIARTPNNILAIEYLKQLSSDNSRIIPLTVKRQGDLCSDTEVKSDYPGAAALRNLIYEGKDCSEYIPGMTSERLYEPGRKSIEDDILFRMTAAAILTSDENDLAQILSVDEGIENRLKLMARNSDSYSSLIDGLTSKRYTRARMRRMCMHILLNIRKDDFDARKKASYSRILAFNEKGRSLLRLTEKERSIKLVNSFRKDFTPDEQRTGVFENEIKATDIFNLVKGRNLYSESEYLKTPR